MKQICILIPMSNEKVETNPIIWEPDSTRIESSAMYQFMRQQGFNSYDSLHAWSVDELPAFWVAVADFCGIHFDRAPESILSRSDNIMDAGWFAGTHLNFASHLLRHRGSEAAIVFRGEDGTRREISRDDLIEVVAQLASSLRAIGVEKGDRVAGYLPNCPEAVIAMLAAASIGAIWSSCSPDFGSNGAIDRFGQIEPKVLFATNAYYYNGKIYDTRETVASIATAMTSLVTTVVIPFVDQVGTSIGIENAKPWDEFLVDDAELEITPVEFNHPLYIMYSSGTTGIPKCIVHGHGGTLLQQSKEHVLHTGVADGDKLFYFTTCGWMMWNWLVCGLGVGATLILFDGAPFFREGRILWEIAEQEGINIFGVSAKYISALENTDVRPKRDFSLPMLRVVLSTGSPLAPKSFDFVYEAIGDNLQLASISGGTDILSCFALGNPLLPVRRGELQCKGLGMATEVYNEDGRSVIGEYGELVCTKPFPSAPIAFWNDVGGKRYKTAYFEQFPGLWAQGDFAEVTPSGGLVIHGRSDAVLNPGGVRIGTAEIYRQVEKLDAVVEGLAIGQQWEGDVRIVLFVLLKEGASLNETLIALIRKTIRDNTTPRHVPAKVIAVPEIPRTKSGKIVELAVRSIVHGEAVNNTQALANPEALEHFRDLAELTS